MGSKAPLPPIDSTWSRVASFESSSTAPASISSSQHEEWEYEDHEELVTLDLGGYGNRLVRGGIKCSLINVDSQHPHLQIGDRIFKGHWEDTIGTDIHLSLERDPTRTSSSQPQHLVSPIPTQAPIPSISRKRLVFKPIVPPAPSASQSEPSTSAPAPAAGDSTPSTTTQSA